MRNQELRDLSNWPFKCVKEWHTYFVNGYKFHTDSWSKGRNTINSGVYVKGLTKGGEDDCYWIIQKIYELQYNSSSYPKKVVLFYCEWFDPSRRGTRVDPKTKIVDIQMNLRYQPFDPFIMAQNVKQVYYISYPPFRMDKRNWCVAIKTKPRRQIDIEIDFPYQVDEMSHTNEVIDIQNITHLQNFDHDAKELEELEDDDDETDDEEDENEKDENEEDEEEEEEEDDDDDEEEEKSDDDYDID